LSDEETVVEVNEETGEIVEVKPKEPKANIVPYEGKSAEMMYMSTSGFELIQRWGKMLAASAMVPDHLQGQPADCALIVSQAMQWGLNPLIVAQSSYTARGKVGYEGKLIAALVNRGLSKKLNYRFSGDGRGLKVQVTGRMKNEDEDRTVEGSWEDWSNERNPAWKTMPKQMMVYRGAREWARRHNPGVISGIMSIDEVQDLEAREEVIDGSFEEKPITPDEAIDDLIGDVNVETPVKISSEEVEEAEILEARKVAAAQRESAKVTPKKRGRPKGSKNKPKPEPEDEPQVTNYEGKQSDTLGGKPQEASVDDLFD
jgi:hypothetical protein